MGQPDAGPSLLFPDRHHEAAASRCGEGTHNEHEGRNVSLASPVMGKCL